MSLKCTNHRATRTPRQLGYLTSFFLHSVLLLLEVEQSPGNIIFHSTRDIKGWWNDTEFNCVSNDEITLRHAAMPFHQNLTALAEKKFDDHFFKDLNLSYLCTWLDIIPKWWMRNSLNLCPTISTWNFSSTWDEVALLIATWPLEADLREGRRSFVYYCVSLHIVDLLGFFVSG